MNQDRFLELLNLYLDDEISPSELSELMAETRVDPERERIFLDYCRIHKACQKIGTDFGSRRERRSVWQTVYALGGLAAAFALLALAGRNLLPFIEGQAGETSVVASQVELSQTSSGLVFAELAETEVLGPRFVAGGEEPRIRVGAPSSQQVPVISYRSLFKTRPSWKEKLPSFGIDANLLESEGIELRDPFKRFEELGQTFRFELSKAGSNSDNDLFERLNLDVAFDSK